MALRCIDGRWKIQILAHLSVERMRLADLGRAIPGASQKMLIQHLRELERDGIVARKVYAEVPPKVDYRLTDWGTRLGPVVRSLVEWAENRDSS